MVGLVQAEDLVQRDLRNGTWLRTLSDSEPSVSKPLTLSGFRGLADPKSYIGSGDSTRSDTVQSPFFDKGERPEKRPQKALHRSLPGPSWLAAEAQSIFGVDCMSC